MTMTRLEQIRNMAADQLAPLLLCPYESVDKMPCAGDCHVTEEQCHECIISWLKEEGSI